MLIAVVVTVILIKNQLNEGNSKSYYEILTASGYTKAFFFDDWLTGNYFWKNFLGGSFYYYWDDRVRSRYDAKKFKL